MEKPTVITGRHPQAPSFWHMIGELTGLRHRVLFNPVNVSDDLRNGGGQPVIVIPGFMVHDVISTRLRRTLINAGYDARGWGLGLNKGLQPGVLEALLALIDRIYAEKKHSIILIGWSLGGLFARELAKLRPDIIDRVITLASPFSGDPRANNAWKLYEKVAGHPVDCPPIDVRLNEKPPVPTIAIWTATDGVVSPECAKGILGERDIEIEVKSRHIDIISSPKSIPVIMQAMKMKKEDIIAVQAHAPSNGISN